ncbi:MAG TPA: ZIP family metal transporter [Actinomycetota bacterium]|nr:ZIP family metal transporter [Actinomycetota bacterium]
MPLWVAGLAPLAVIGILVALFLAFNPIGSLREIPPVEAIAVERTVFTSDAIEMKVRNDGPDEVTIAQVLVNDSYWNFSMSDETLGRLESSDITIPYPWEEGLPVNLALITSTGATIEHQVAVATLTPEADAETLGVYALLGLYIGVIPVAVGLLWFSALSRTSKKWLNFFLAFTVGLLAFLLVDTVSEGLELSGAAPATLDGLSLFALGTFGSVIGLTVLQQSLGRRAGAKGASTGALTLAYLVAAGIGLHNLGEGLAVGAALAVGEVALGTFLVLGFALHNTTEGLAIIAPLGSMTERPPIGHFIGLGALAGVPTILGAWLGGFAFSPAWGALAFGVAAGAIGQVIWQIGASMQKGRAVSSAWNGLGFIAGLVFMYVTGLLTA